MATEILKSFGTLQSELEQAKTSLKGVDENIKRLIGRDPSELPPRSNPKRPPPAPVQTVHVHNPQRVTHAHSQSVRSRNFGYEYDEPPVKRRTGVSVFTRLSDRVVDYGDEVHQGPQKGIVSKVIVTPKELPSRQDALAAQSKDEKSKARNRRMFGALLGTLQKFQQEETKLKLKEDKRANIEKKIEEHEIKEKEEIKKERQELFFNRKKKQAEIKMIELKMMRMKEYATWEERQKPRMDFILTKAKPHIHYLPRKMTDVSKTLLETCKQDIEKMIDKKRQEVFDELQHIEDRMKKNFETKKVKDVDNLENVEEKHEDDEEDDDNLEQKVAEESQQESSVAEDITQYINQQVPDNEPDNETTTPETLNKKDSKETSEETEKQVEENHDEGQIDEAPDNVEEVPELNSVVSNGAKDTEMIAQDENKESNMECL